MKVQNNHVGREHRCLIFVLQFERNVEFILQGERTKDKYERRKDESDCFTEHTAKFLILRSKENEKVSISEVFAFLLQRVNEENIRKAFS